MSAEERSRIVRKAIALIDQIREEVRAEEAAKLEAERLAFVEWRQSVVNETGLVVRNAVDQGRALERADAVAYLREHKGAWERAAAAIDGGKHLRKGVN